MSISRPILSLTVLAATLLSVTPFSAVWAQQGCQAQQLSTSIPYIWTRKPTGREADAMASMVDDELKRLLLDATDAADWPDALARIQVQSASLTGYSSPESLKGTDSIRPENVEAVNVKVGKRRADALKAAVTHSLNPLGLKEEAVSTAGDERQFTTEEWNALHQIATGKEALGIIDVPAVYKLLLRLKQKPESFADGQLNALKQVLADKKSVDVSLCYSITPKPPTVEPAAPVVAPTPEPATESTKERPALKRTPLKGTEPLPLPENKEEAKPESADPMTSLAELDADTISQWLLDNLWLIIIALSTAVLGIWALFRFTDLLAESSPRSHKARTHRRRSWSATGPRMLAIMSGKGGTGKSSISSSLSYGLAHLGYKTLLVDVDLFTHGLTVLNQPAIDPVSNCVPLKHIFDPVTAGDSPVMPTPVAIKTRYTGDNLFVLPSIPVSDVDLDSMPVAAFEPLELPAPHNETKPFAEQLKQSLEQVCAEHQFDYVILDTRGGADHTSVGAALAATAFILVTEADKPSWAISDRLLDTVYAVRKEVEMNTKPLGFVINKNALPADEIEIHLGERWEMKHLGTLPYDPTVIRCFEKARIPLAEDSNAKFSEGVFALIRRLDHARIWD